MNRIIQHNVTNTPWPLRDNSVDCCITSPPYWQLRNYGIAGQLGLEKTPEEYVHNMVMVFREVRRVLKPHGTLWLNLGDSYAASAKNRTKEQATAKTKLQGSTVTQTSILQQQSKIINGLKPKDLVGIPWAVAFALRDAGWYLRQDIIWHKPNPMPESVKDRCTKAHEYIFLLSKSSSYYFDQDAIKTVSNRAGEKSYHDFNNPKYDAIVDDRWKDQFDGRVWGKEGHANKRSVWTVATNPFADAHFATFPEELILPCVLAGCPPFTCDCDNCKKHYYSFNEQETKNKDLSGLQAKISSNRPMEPGENFLHEEVQHKMGGEEQAIHQRVDDYNQGIQDDFDSASSQRKQGWVCNGAQVENGKEIGETPKENGGCPPSKSQQTGQSNLQFAGFNQEPTRQIEKAADSANSLPALWQENQSVGTCPACGGNLILKKGVILDCFMGAGTTAMVAKSHDRNYIGLELNPDYIKIAEARLSKAFGMFHT